jgi:hypothetical protein
VPKKSTVHNIIGALPFDLKVLPNAIVMSLYLVLGEKDVIHLNAISFT